MSVMISDLIPNPDDLLALDVEELAGVLLMHLNSGAGAMHNYNFFVGLRNYPVYASGNHDKVNRALMEAWDWLRNEGFIAAQADDSSRSAVFVTRRGERIKSLQSLRLTAKPGS